MGPTISCLIEEALFGALFVLSKKMNKEYEIKAVCVKVGRLANDAFKAKSMGDTFKKLMEITTLIDAVGVTRHHIIMEAGDVRAYRCIECGWMPPGHQGSCKEARK